MDESPQTISDDSKSDIEIRSEPDEDNSHFCDTPKPSRNGSACTTQQINLEKPDNQAQKRKQPSQEDLVSKKHRASLAYQTSDDDSVSEDEKFYMIVYDLSKDFPIKQFLEECGVVDINDMIKNNTRQVQLTFENETDRNTAIQRLGEEGITGHIARPKLSGEDADFNDNVLCTTEVVSQSSWKPIEDIWKANPNGLYGLKPEFIKLLDISSPLDMSCLVHVTNFTCDKDDLRDVMNLAGNVIMLSMINVNKTFALVQYSHPLEAVQAVSMLNDQLCFGSRLKVCMEKNPKNDIILPKGLDNIGVGLGLQGRPIRDVVRQYKKYSRQQNSAINPILFHKNIFNDEDNSKDEDDLDKTDDKHMNISQFMALAKTAAFINDRSFVVRHVEDFNNIEGNSCKKDAANRCQSPGSNSVKSVDSTTSNCDRRDADKPSDLHKPRPTTSLPPEIPGHTVPIRLSLSNPAINFPRLILPQNPSIRPQGVLPTTLGVRSVPKFANRPYPGPFQPGLNRMPNPKDNSMTVLSPMLSPPMALAPTQPYKPQAPVPPLSAIITTPGPGPVQRPGPSSGSMHRPGLISGPGTESMHRPGLISGPGPESMHRPGLISGPGPASMHRPGLISGPGSGTHPVSGPHPVSGSHPVSGPHPASGPHPVSGPHTVSGPYTVSGPAGPLSAGRVAVQLTNMPPAMTFSKLFKILLLYGEVVSLQFTTPGCANASFLHPRHAEICMESLNGETVHGYTIAVNYM